MSIEMFEFYFYDKRLEWEKTLDNNDIFKKVFYTAWPAVLESFFIALTGTIDTMMVASLGTFAVAAVGLTTQPKFLGLSIFFAINMAVSAFVARRRGEKNQKKANETLLTAFMLSMAFTAVITALCVVFAPQIMILAGSKTDTHKYAVEYFRIIMGLMVFSTVSMTINAAQRGSGNTRIAFTTNLVSSIVNICFNYLLIGGNFGFPKMGVRGAAIATVMGSAVAALMSIISLFKKDSYVRIRYIIENNIKHSLVTTKQIMRFSANIFAENIAMRIGFMVTAFMAARLGTDIFAVHQTGMNVLALSFSFADGMQVAAIALTGAALGSGQKEEAKKYGKMCQMMGFGISLIISIALIFFSRRFFALYFDDSTNLDRGELVSRFLMVITLLQISQVIYGACLRAAGDIRYALMASTISVTIIRSSVTIILTGIFHLGLIGIWFGILSDQLSRYIFMSIRFKQGKWVDLKIT